MKIWTVTLLEELISANYVTTKAFKTENEAVNFVENDIKSVRSDYNTHPVEDRCHPSNWEESNGDEYFTWKIKSHLLN